MNTNGSRLKPGESERYEILRDSQTERLPRDQQVQRSIPETLASGVIWNFFGDGFPGNLSQGGATFVKPSPDGEAIVIGVNGKHQVYDDSRGNTVSPFIRGELMPPSDGLRIGTGTGALGNVLYEGLYQPGLDPESLYDTQLENRIGGVPSVAACREFGLQVELADQPVQVVRVNP
jgi:hypothetical protein